MKNIEVVAAILRKDDRIFATEKGYGEFKGYWEFPGGKLGGSLKEGNSGRAASGNPNRRKIHGVGLRLSAFSPYYALLFLFRFIGGNQIGGSNRRKMA